MHTKSITLVDIPEDYNIKQILFWRWLCDLTQRIKVAQNSHHLTDKPGANHALFLPPSLHQCSIADLTLHGQETSWNKQGCHLRARGLLWAWAPATFVRKQRIIEPKELPSCTSPLLLIAYTRQLEILATALETRVWGLIWESNSGPLTQKAAH